MFETALRFKSREDLGAHLQVVLHPGSQNLLKGVIGVLFDPAINIHAFRTEFNRFCWKIPFLANKRTKAIRGNQTI